VKKLIFTVDDKEVFQTDSDTVPGVGHFAEVPTGPATLGPGEPPITGLVKAHLYRYPNSDSVVVQIALDPDAVPSTIAKK
jgi:hypothetical protein